MVQIKSKNHCQIYIVNAYKVFTFSAINLMEPFSYGNGELLLESVFSALRMLLKSKLLLYGHKVHFEKKGINQGSQ